jgi:hypothetical protein
MSTKNETTQTASRINWPKTEARKAEEIQKQGEAIQAVAKVGQIMAAASVVPMPRAKKLMADVAAEAVKGAIGTGKKGKGKKKSWEKHADQYFAANKAWDEVMGIYIASSDLLRTSLALTPLLRQPELLKKVKNVRLLTRNISAITRDTVTLSGALAKIFALHKDKSGGSKSQEEMMDSCAIFSQYVDFIERYDSALMPIVVHASEQLNEALQLLRPENPELAHALDQNMTASLNSIRTIIADTTGADVIATPGTDAANEAPALAEAQAA